MAKVMLVEDDNNLREIYEARMMAEGYDVVTAKDGEEALVVAKANQPDLVVSDVMMPKISGFEMLDILRNTQGLKDVKVIMLTALGQSDDQLRADKLGADRYLVKSQVTLEDIVQSARELLGGESDDVAALGVTSTEVEAETAPEAATAPETVPVTETVAVPEAPIAVAPEPVAIAPEPVATAPAPVVADPAPQPEPTAIPEPVAVPQPEPVSTPSPVSTLANDTQSTSEEAAAVEAQIEEFIAGAAESSAPAEVVAPAAPVTDLFESAAVAPAPTPEVAVAPQVVEPTTSPSDTAQDDKIMNDAINTLAGGADSTPQVVAPTGSAPVSSDTATDDTTAEPAVSPSLESSGTKKVIAPLDHTGERDITQILAEEEAKEIAAQPAPPTPPVEPPIPPASVITPAEEAPQEAAPQPARPIDAPLPDTVSFNAPVSEETPGPLQQPVEPTLPQPAFAAPDAPAPTPEATVPVPEAAAPAPQPPSQPAATPAPAAPVAPQPPAQKPIDPNSIAL